MANLYAYEKWRTAKKRIQELVSDGRNLYLIHYNCESLSKEDGTSPRIATISIRNFSSSEELLFSLHKEHEVLFRSKKPTDLSVDELDLLENNMLSKYFTILDRLKDNNFVHWKMRDETYGFAAIQHRAAVLGVANAIDLTFKNRHDLSVLVESIYGPKYTSTHPHLQKLVEINNITTQGAVWGIEEVKLFSEREFRKLQNSVLRKTSILREILELTAAGTLVTEGKLSDLFSSKILAKYEILRENPWFGLLTFVFATVGVVATIWKVINLFV